jgi:hypothetical protein
MLDSADGPLGRGRGAGKENMPNDQAQYATIAEVAAELNGHARGRAIGDLQEIRRQLKGHPRLPTRKLFDGRTTFDSYAFHVGGRTELQFNIGPESGDQDLRYGVAFSLETNQTLPDIDVLARSARRFSDFLTNHPDEYGDLRMWHYANWSRSSDYAPGPIPSELFRPRVFIFLGELRPRLNIDYDRILDVFDRLLHLYRYVEGTMSYPAIAPVNGAFTFVPGCTVKPATTTASAAQRELDVFLRHNEIQLALYRHLVSKYGDVVSTEQANGAGGRIDVVLRHGSDYWFYEIKTALSARGCVGEGLAQLLEYSFWPRLQEAKRLIIVGEPAPDADTNTFLARLRSQFALPVYYERFDMASGQLVG